MTATMSETIVKTLNMGKVGPSNTSSTNKNNHSLTNTIQGITLKLLLNPSEPEDSLSRWTTEGVVEGRPGDDILEVPPHWHRLHSEVMDVREGRVEVTIDGVARIVVAGDKAHIPAGSVHSIKSFPGERVVVRESADPPGDYKHL